MRRILLNINILKLFYIKYKLFYFSITFYMTKSLMKFKVDIIIWNGLNIFYFISD